MAKPKNVRFESSEEYLLDARVPTGEGEGELRFVFKSLAKAKAFVALWKSAAPDDADTFTLSRRVRPVEEHRLTEIAL